MDLALLHGPIIGSIMDFGLKGDNMALAFIFLLRVRRNLENGLMENAISGLQKRRHARFTAIIIKTLIVLIIIILILILNE